MLHGEQWAVYSYHIGIKMNSQSHGLGIITLNNKQGVEKTLQNSPSVAFAVCECFDFPKLSLLMASLQHET